jgi:hypothetical protein
LEQCGVATVLHLAFFLKIHTGKKKKKKVSQAIINKARLVLLHTSPLQLSHQVKAILN